MQFNIDDFAQLALTLSTPPKSLTFGRAFYRFQYQQQQYWLKTQDPSAHPHYVTGFLNELDFYRQGMTQSHWPCILLPSQIVLCAEAVHPYIPAGQTALILSDAAPRITDCTALSVWQIKTTLMDMIEAVQQLHQRGWIHGDLKKQHFVQYQQQTCLIDFEQAQRLNLTAAQQGLTATPRYMAPELFQGAEKTVQTDIYALGIIVYEWLTGQRLAAKNYQDWAYLHCQYLQIQLPPHLLQFETLLTGMLAKQKQHRFIDMQRVKECLITESV
ncbi:protein kinase [Acinetobacter sp.]|uniref:protein kinase domain-containing protein n=1 Tax=Acinetobacter sp. TaxID=472 RepID=UPI00257DFA29|nr:protein kinase [Acinetobacter sp.]